MTDQVSYQLNDDEIEYLSFLLGTIDEQNWHALRYAILSNPIVFQSFCRTVSRSEELNGMTVLHACVRFNPPLQIIKLFIDLVPEAPAAVDCLQRTPLHVAAGTRASAPLIKLLADAYPRACDIQDDDGKTPLHLACDTACELFEGDGDSKRVPPSLEVVQALVAASPNSVPLEDLDGMSALEHAIFSDAPIHVVKLLQHVTRKLCEARQQQEQLQSMVIEEYSAPLLSRRVSVENPPVQHSHSGGVEDMVTLVYQQCTKVMASQ